MVTAGVTILGLWLTEDPRELQRQPWRRTLDTDRTAFATTGGSGSQATQSGSDPGIHRRHAQAPFELDIKPVGVLQDRLGKPVRMEHAPASIHHHRTPATLVEQIRERGTGSLDRAEPELDIDCAAQATRVKRAR
jgi:hypothetical protein